MSQRHHKRLAYPRTVRALSLSVLCAASLGWSQDSNLTAPMVLCTNFEIDPPSRVKEGMQQELASAMASTGLRFEWRSLSGSAGAEQAVAIAVVSFKGRCNLTHMSRGSQRKITLGLTHISEGAIIPFSDIDCDRIRNFIREELFAEKAERREELLGRAIARVLAHELYHVLANTTKHGSTGLGRPNLMAHELISDACEFDKKQSLAMQRGEIAKSLANAANYLVQGRPAADQLSTSDRTEGVAGQGEVGIQQVPEK